MENRSCFSIRLDGLTKYLDGLNLQNLAFEKVVSGKADCILILLEHKPVITVGKSGGRENLLVDERELERLGVELRNTNRGGNITYHGPGQVVAYPILNLGKWKKNLPWYVHSLEEVVIRVLGDYGIEAGRKPEYRGVWVEESKIAAVGIAVKRWFTMHGFALNVRVNKEHFRLINPCGIKDYTIASMDDFVADVDFHEIIESVERNFSLVFESKLIEVSREWLESGQSEGETRLA
ncbi:MULTISPECIES: lipoyl(octanoyl) transferase LipB [unclassified Mesotoga]|uniref:lipoyl(octanoyl) transferase LipB n=1 Tax=unclassified Mesotoga TaxID=1184398 RepID=UPI000DA6D740|nr:MULTISPECIES: lipoyl(octanoyl) transferase LipB [unclassified Mesotoga]PZC51692.1 octanoyltransferase [Mesotoga sp. TolDC]